MDEGKVAGFGAGGEDSWVGAAGLPLGMIGE